MLKIITARTFKEKLIGLIGQKTIKYGMFFPNVNSIHTFFMKDCIDVIGLNPIKQITEIHPYVKPNHVLFLKKSVHTLELPKGYSKKYKIGDYIKL